MQVYYLSVVIWCIVKVLQQQPFSSTKFSLSKLLKCANLDIITLSQLFSDQINHTFFHHHHHHQLLLLENRNKKEESRKKRNQWLILHIPTTLNFICFNDDNNKNIKKVFLIIIFHIKKITSILNNLTTTYVPVISMEVKKGQKRLKNRKIGLLKIGHWAR